MKIVYSLSEITEELFVDKAEVLLLEKSSAYNYSPGTCITFKNGKKVFVKLDIKEVYKKLYE